MIAITNGKVFTITQGTLDPGTVLIEDGRIVAVGAEIEIPEAVSYTHLTLPTILLV